MRALAIISAAALCACSSKTKHQPEVFGSVPAAQTQVAPHAEPSHATTVVAAATPSASHHKEMHPGVAPTTALKWLTNGNTRFLRSAWRKDGAAKKDIERLSQGQHPHSIVVSCSDSRVPPEVVFDQKLGEVFTVRTAGQSLDHNSIGSIEYAVEHLGARLVVVMGHTSCGAVKAALDTMGGASAGTESLDALVRDIHPRLASFKGHEKSPSLEKESWANAEGVASDLLSRSKLLSEQWTAGHILVVPALYDLKTGRVSFHDSLKAQTPRTPAAH